MGDRAMFLVNGVILGCMLMTSPPKDTSVGKICFLVNFLLMAMWFIKRRFSYAFSMLLAVLGFVLQLKLAPLCGDASYAKPEDETTGCWRACPLPVVGYANPFNHNALYHTVYALSLAILESVPTPRRGVREPFQSQRFVPHRLCPLPGAVGRCRELSAGVYRRHDGGGEAGRRK